MVRKLWELWGHTVVVGGGVGFDDELVSTVL